MKWNEALREAREKANKTPYDVENEIGISHVNIYRWENGVEPKVENLIKLANYYNVSLDVLVGNNDFLENTQVEELKKNVQINTKYYKCNF